MRVLQNKPRPIAKSVQPAAIHSSMLIWCVSVLFVPAIFIRNMLSMKAMLSNAQLEVWTSTNETILELRTSEE